jgi:hypothetical protein
MDNSTMPILLSATSPRRTLWIGFWISVWIDMLLLTLWLWRGLNPILVIDHLHVGDDNGFFISDIRHITLHTPKHTFILSNVLHVPHITKPLLYVQKIYHDNNVYFEFHESVFYNKETPRQCYFLVRVTMVSMFCPSFLPYQFLKLTCLLMYLFMLISDIVN